MFKSLLVVSLGFAAVLSGCGGRGGPPSPERIQKMVAWKLDDALDDLNATDSQRAQIVPIKDRLLQDAQPLIADHQKARADFLEQWDSAKPDASRVHSLVDARVDALRGFAHKLADAALQVHAVLTPEQRAEISQRASRHR